MSASKGVKCMRQLPYLQNTIDQGRVVASSLSWRWLRQMSKLVRVVAKTKGRISQHRQSRTPSVRIKNKSNSPTARSVHNCMKHLLGSKSGYFRKHPALSSSSISPKPTRSQSKTKQRQPTFNWGLGLENNSAKRLLRIKSGRGVFLPAAIVEEKG